MLPPSSLLKYVGRELVYVYRVVAKKVGTDTLWEEEKKWSQVWASGYNRQENCPFQDPIVFFSQEGNWIVRRKRGHTIIFHHRREMDVEYWGKNSPLQDSCMWEMQSQP
jgi:hypothetical protein